MGPLIEITNVPIEIEMKVSHAKLEYTRGTAELEISRDNGGLSIKSRPIRLNIDTFEIPQFSCAHCSPVYPAKRREGPAGGLSGHRHLCPAGQSFC